MSGPAEHHVTVPPSAGLAPYCSCGWPKTEGGKNMVWRPGDKTAAQHLAEVKAERILSDHRLGFMGTCVDDDGLPGCEWKARKPVERHGDFGAQHRHHQAEMIAARPDAARGEGL